VYVASLSESPELEPELTSLPFSTLQSTSPRLLNQSATSNQAFILAVEDREPCRSPLFRRSQDLQSTGRTHSISSRSSTRSVLLSLRSLRSPSGLNSSPSSHAQTPLTVQLHSPLELVQQLFVKLGAFFPFSTRLFSPRADFDLHFLHRCSTSRRRQRKGILSRTHLQVAVALVLGKARGGERSLD